MEPWSPAELGGLRDADRVLEVNEEFVDKMDIHRVGVRDSAKPEASDDICFIILDIGDKGSCLCPCQVFRKIQSCGLNLFLLVLNREHYQQVRPLLLQSLISEH